MRERGNPDKIARATARPPTGGVVKPVDVTAAGQVVQPGHDLIEIALTDDAPLVEVPVSSQDIALLQHAPEAMVKITAYDYAIHGEQKAQLDHIGGTASPTKKARSAIPYAPATGPLSQLLFLLQLTKGKS